MELKNKIEEANRYLQNAKDLLKNNTTIENNFYSDSKYVRMAGDTAWKGCLIAVDAAYNVKEEKKKGRLDVVDYRNAIANKDKKLLVCFNDGYSCLHLSMGYDGIKSVNVVKESFKIAKEIIDRCAIRMGQK